MSFKLEITGESVEELRDHAIFAATSLMTTEELESILQDRKGEPAQEKPAAARRRGRPPKTVEAAPMTDPAKTLAAVVGNEVARLSPEEHAKLTSPEPAHGPRHTLPVNRATEAAKPNSAEAAGKPEPTGPSKTDVITALDKYATSHPEGIAGARAVMEKTTGFIALNKVPEAQFGALIDALAAA